MYRVQLSHKASGRKVFYGDPIQELDHAHDVVLMMEQEWNMWSDKKFPQLTPDNPIQFLEDSDIYVVRDDGLVYILNDNGVFQILN